MLCYSSFVLRHHLQGFALLQPVSLIFFLKQSSLNHEHKVPESRHLFCYLRIKNPNSKERRTEHRRTPREDDRSGQKIIQRGREKRENCLVSGTKHESPSPLEQRGGSAISVFLKRTSVGVHSLHTLDKWTWHVSFGGAGAGYAVLSSLSLQSGNCLQHFLTPWCHQLARAPLSLGLRRCRLPPPVITR